MATFFRYAKIVLLLMIFVGAPLVLVRAYFNDTASAITQGKADLNRLPALKPAENHRK